MNIPDQKKNYSILLLLNNPLNLREKKSMPYPESIVTGLRIWAVQRRNRMRSTQR